MSIKQKREEKSYSTGCIKCYKLTGVGHDKINHQEIMKDVVACKGSGSIVQCPCVGGYVEGGRN